MQPSKYDDPLQLMLERAIEVLKDPDFKPHLIKLLEGAIEHQKAETRDLESQTLARLERINSTHKVRT